MYEYSYISYIRFSLMWRLVIVVHHLFGFWNSCQVGEFIQCPILCPGASRGSSPVMEKMWPTMVVEMDI